MEKLSYTFKELLEETNKNIKKTIRIKYAKVCEKIRELENCGIIHNDLHLNNIMFDKNGEPKIIDYGRSYHLPGIIDHNKIIELLNIRRSIADIVTKFVKMTPNKTTRNVKHYNKYNDESFTIMLTDKGLFNKLFNRFEPETKEKYLKIIYDMYQYYIIQDCIIYPGTFMPYLTREEEGIFL